MDFFEVVRKRRSIRRFKPDPVPDEHIEKIIEAARWAQSGANGQPWEFIVVKNPATREKIAESYQGYRWRAYHIEKTRIMEARHLGFLDPPTRPPSFQDAPVFIVVCGDPRTAQSTVLIAHFLNVEGGPGAHFLKNMGNTTQILTLAAAALGLGSAWISVDSVFEDDLKSMLDIPPEIAVHTVVPIGYPDYEAKPSYRRELKDIMHFEKYDRSRYRSTEDIYQFLLSLRSQTKSAYNK